MKRWRRVRRWWEMKTDLERLEAISYALLGLIWVLILGTLMSWGG